MIRIKKILILLIIILCTGCNIKYNVSFTDEKVSEDINISNLKFNTHNELMSPIEYFFQSKVYNNGYDVNNNFFANQTWKNIDVYIDNSILFDDFLNSDSIKVNNKKISIDFDINPSVYTYISNFGNIDSLEISLYIPYYVSKNNATSVKNNTYVWKFNNLNDARLQIDFDLSKSYKYKEFLISLCIIIGFSVIIISIIIFFVVKHRKVNNI